MRWRQNENVEGGALKRVGFMSCFTLIRNAHDICVWTVEGVFDLRGFNP